MNRVLRGKLYSRDAPYTGDEIGDIFDKFVQGGVAEGYDRVELEWWDICDGWVSMSMNINRSKEVALCP